MTPRERAGYHVAIGLMNKADSYASAAKRGVAALNEPAELSTTAIKAGERAANAAKGAVETLRDPAKAKEAARRLSASRTKLVAQAARKEAGRRS